MEQQKPEAKPDEERGLLEWFGAIVVSGVVAALVAAAWGYLLLSIAWALPSSEDDAIDFTTLPVRSILVGLAVGCSFVLQRLYRILTQEKRQWPWTAAWAVGFTLLPALASHVDENLWMQAATAWLIVASFSALHLSCAVLVRTSRWLMSIRLPGLTVALSLSGFLPFCGGAVVADDLAEISEPTTKIDAADFAEGVASFLRDSCFAEVVAWRVEAEQRLRSKGLGREDAEDVVSEVTLSVCTQPGVRDDLRAYFFKSVERRSADPWRTSAKHRKAEKYGDFFAPPPLPPTDALVLAKDARNDAHVQCAARELQALSEQDRAIVIAVAAHGASRRDVAMALNMSKSALQRRCAAAIAKLARNCR